VSLVAVQVNCGVVSLVGEVTDKAPGVPGVEANAQLVLLATLVLLYAVRAVALLLLLSRTDTYWTFRLPLGLIYHWVPVLEDTSDSLFDASEPLSVRAPCTFFTFDAPLLKVRVAGDVTCLVRLKKVIGPLRVWLVPSSTTVPVPALKVDPDTAV
jgi:hypothetical protein